METLQLAPRVDAIAKELAQACTTCESRHYTANCGIVVLSAQAVGRVCCVTLADTAGHREKCLLNRVLRGDLGCSLGEAELIFWDVFNHPHPRMRGSAKFLQCELFRRFQKCP